MRWVTECKRIEAQVGKVLSFKLRVDKVKTNRLYYRWVYCNFPLFFSYVVFVINWLTLFRIWRLVIATLVCDFLEILKPHSFCCLVAFESGPAQGLGLRTPPQKIFALYKNGPHPIVKGPKFYKKYEFF